MHLIGTKQETDLVLEVDWVVIGTLFGLLLLLILLFTALFYFYSQLTWYLPPITVIEYREKQMKLKIKGDKGKRTNMQYFIQGMPV